MQHLVRRRLAHLSYAVGRAFIGIADALAASERPKPVQLSTDIEGFALRIASRMLTAESERTCPRCGEPQKTMAVKAPAQLGGTRYFWDNCTTCDGQRRSEDQGASGERTPLTTTPPVLL